VKKARIPELVLQQFGNKCIGDDTKAVARQNPICIKKQKDKIWRTTIFNMVDGIITPCNVADHDIDFARWQHPAMWQVAVG